MNALDISNESTCWNSDGQADGNIDLSFVVNFHRPVLVEEIKIQFQGGFVAEECTLYTCTYNKASGGGDGASIEWKEIEDAYIEPENINSIQSFPLEETEESDRLCNAIKLCFDSGTDFYGRVIIYKLEIVGEEKQT
jgi:hypothetical protein